MADVVTWQRIILFYQTGLERRKVSSIAYPSRGKSLKSEGNYKNTNKDADLLVRCPNRNPDAGQRVLNQRK